jgi:hypothetical protein
MSAVSSIMSRLGAHLARRWEYGLWGKRRVDGTSSAVSKIQRFSGSDVGGSGTAGSGGLQARAHLVQHRAALLGILGQPVVAAGARLGHHLSQRILGRAGQ